MYQIHYHFFREPSHTKIQCVQQAKNKDAAYYFIQYIIEQGWQYDMLTDVHGIQVSI